MAPRVHYYLSASGAIYRRRGQRIEIYSVWARPSWLRLFVPLRYIGPWRRVTALRAWLECLRLRARRWHYERIEVF
jgi:hypothetical protein